eukprot:scaffold61473_cov23-Tisochrysis_lutea.AAC.1
MDRGENGGLRVKALCFQDACTWNCKECAPHPIDENANKYMWEGAYSCPCLQLQMQPINHPNEIFAAKIQKRSALMKGCHASPGVPLLVLTHHRQGHLTMPDKHTGLANFMKSSLIYCIIPAKKLMYRVFMRIGQPFKRNAWFSSLQHLCVHSPEVHLFVLGQLSSHNGECNSFVEPFDSLLRIARMLAALECTFVHLPVLGQRGNRNGECKSIVEPFYSNHCFARALAALERTFLSWVSMAVTMGSVSSVLMSFTNPDAHGEQVCTFVCLACSGEALTRCTMSVR